MTSPLVSILINNYNYESYLGAAIDSALAQTYPHIEVVVVDDGSTDGSRRLIESYGDRIVPVLKTNGGHASAINAGFRVSSGELICLLDADDLFVPSKVAEVVRAFQTCPDIDWCVHPIYNWDMSYEKAPPQLSYSHPPKLDPIDFREAILAGRQPYFLPPCSGLSFSRRITEEMMPIPEDGLYLYGDYYLSIVGTALSKGCNLDEQLTIYRKHGSNAYNTQIAKARISHAKNGIVGNYFIQERYPQLREYMKISMSKGIGVHWLVKKPDLKCNLFAKKFLESLSPLERIQILARASFYATKSLVKKTLV